MKNFAFLADLSRRFSSLRRDERGVSAIEFAMLLPLMVTLYLGAVEISEGVAAHRKVTLTARAVADLASQTTKLKNADMTNVLNAATAVATGVRDISTKLKVTVSEVEIDANGVAKIKWSDARNGTARSVGSTVTLPAALNVPSTFLIWSEVSYNYVPIIGYVVTGAMNLTDEIYMRPRLSNEVVRDPS
jgi:Flp pilus assembly protein TadG